MNRHKQVNIQLTEEERRRYKLRCIGDGRTMQEVGHALLVAYADNASDDLNIERIVATLAEAQAEMESTDAQ